MINRMVVIRSQDKALDPIEFLREYVYTIDIDRIDQDASYHLILDPKANPSLYRDPAYTQDAFVRSMQPDLNEADIDEVIQKITESNILVQKAWLEQLLIDSNASSLKIQKATGLPRSSIDKVLSLERPLSKHTFFALALIFGFREDQVINYARELGIDITDKIADAVFMKYIENNCFQLESYVKTVRRVYKVIEDCSDTVVKMPKFFIKDYQNNNIMIRPR